MNRTLRIRLGIVAVASLLTLLVTIQPGHSQIGGPGGSIRGGPPINPGMPGPPGGIGGIGGGISGRPPGFPEIPRPPIGIGGGIGGGGIGGGIGGGGVETEWLCGLCRKVLARGPTPPAETICPLCRTTNVAPGTRPGVPNPGGGLLPTAPAPGPLALPPAGGPPIAGPQANLIVPPSERPGERRSFANGSATP